MREIKFRAWVPKERVMVAWEELIADHYEFNEFNVEGGLIFLQYTGFRDENGKEIYEGDILECVVMHDCNIDYFGHKPPRYIVTWGTHGYVLEYYGRWSSIPYEIQYWEVIGNIYENPELLEKRIGNTA